MAFLARFRHTGVIGNTKRRIKSLNPERVPDYHERHGEVNQLPPEFMNNINNIKFP